MDSILISSVEGNSQWLDGGAMFGNAPRAVWEKWIPPDDKARIPLACRSLLIETGKEKILCETGIGCFFEPKLAERYGVGDASEHKLLLNLKKIGIEPEQITKVILSHLHFDHAGGLLPHYNEQQKGIDGLVFPNAEIVVGKEAWERALHPHPRDRASFILGLTDKILKTGKLKIIEKDTQTLLNGRIHFSFTHGHTPGHMHTLLKGDQHKVFFCGDLVPGRAWIHVPITMGYDRFAEQVIDEKSAVYKKAFPEHWIMFFTHDHAVAAATLKEEKGRYSAAEEWPALKHFAV